MLILLIRHTMLLPPNTRSMKRPTEIRCHEEQSRWHRRARVRKATIGSEVGGQKRDLEVERDLKCLNKPAIKTIKSDDGEIIDCIDIYKQPAFDHPLLKNHTIQMEPKFLPKILTSKSSALPIQQSWMENGSCPERTIPIRRVLKSDLLRATSLERFGRKQPIQSHGTIATAGNGTQVGAGVAFANSAGHWHGASAELNVWGVTVDIDGFSLTAVTVSNDKSPNSFLEAGYGAHPRIFGDSKSRLFAYWTADNSRSTGCFNLLCAGFVQVNSQIALGGVLSPLSTYDGPQYGLVTSIYKDIDNSRWWLSVKSQVVGYWPMSIINDLNAMVNAAWAGWVFNPDGGTRTTTQMGSGHFPDEGFKRSAYIGNVLVINQDNSVPPDNSIPFATKTGCYNVKSLGAGNGHGFNLLYGGPGGPDCGA